jgi:hypothetical protein
VKETASFFATSNHRGSFVEVSEFLFFNSHKTQEEALSRWLCALFATGAGSPAPQILSRDGFFGHNQRSLHWEKKSSTD